MAVTGTLEDSDGSTSADDGPEWERVLWRPQPFPDNYVPPTFLAALSKNRNHPRISKSTLLLTFYLSCSKRPPISILAAGVRSMYDLPTPIRHIRVSGCLHSTT
jgi:hypothetical protein